MLLQDTTPRKTASYNVIQPNPTPTPTPTRYITTCLIDQGGNYSPLPPPGRRASSGHNTTQDSIIQRHTTQPNPPQNDPIHNYLPNRPGGKLLPTATTRQAGVLLQGQDTTPRKTASYNPTQPNTTQHNATQHNKLDIIHSNPYRHKPKTKQHNTT